MPPTQQTQFNTAIASLTPEQKTAYTKSNPNIGVGGVQQSYNTATGSYEPTVLETGTKLDKTIPELNQKGNAIAQEVTSRTTTGDKNLANNGGEFDYSKALGLGINAADNSGLFAESNEAKQLREMMKQSNDAQAQASLSAIQQQYAAQEGLLVESQQASSKGLENVLNLGGSSRYAPVSSMGLVQAKNRYDMQTLADLHAKEEAAKANVLQAQREGNFKLMESQLNSLESLRKDKLSYANKIAENMAEQNKEIRDRLYNQQQELQKNISNITIEAGKNGASQDVITKIGNAKTLGEAVSAAGDYLQGGTGIVGEYNYYKKDATSRGLTPISFDEYQTRDANRKLTQAKAGAISYTYDENGNLIATGNYDALTIGRYNRAVNNATTILQKNPTFKNIIGSSAYLDRIEAAVKNPGSVGDQELLDAFTQLNTGGNRVTEAQVHLITSNQSVGDLINKWKNKLSSGGALSQQQRDEIVKLSQEVYKNYQKSYLPLYNDATSKLKAQGIPKEFWNIPSPDTLSRAVNEAGSTGDEIIKTQQQEEDTVNSGLNKIKVSNPTLYKTASSMWTSVNPTTGNPYTAGEILQAFPELKY